MMKTTIVSFALLLGLSGFALSEPPPAPASAPGPGAAQGAAETRASAGASAAEAAAKADVLLTESEVWISELESAVKGGNDGSGCPSNFNLRAYLRDKKEKKISKSIGDTIPAQDSRAKAEWDFHFVCNALAAKNPASCSELADHSRLQGAVGDGSMPHASFNTEKDMCTAVYSRMRVKIAASTRDPKFMDVCRDMVQAWWPTMKSPASVDAICSAWQISRQGNSDEEDARGAEKQARAKRAAGAEQQVPPAIAARVKGLVTAISNGVKMPLNHENAEGLAFESVFGSFWFSSGDEEMSKLSHQELSDYVAAFAKKDANSCKGGMCRMLMVGSAASCDQYAVKVKKQVCARYYRGKFSDDRGPLIEERLKLAEALVSGATGKVGNLREAQAFTERIDRIYALRGRLTSAVLVLSTLSQKQQGAPVKAGTKKIK